MEKSKQDYQIKLKGLQQEIENIKSDKSAMALKKENSTTDLENKKLEYYYAKLEYLKLKLESVKYNKTKLDLINLIKKEWQKILNILEENIKTSTEEKNLVDEANLIYRKEKQKYAEWVKEFE